MTSTIKVDNIQDQDGNNIINENSNTITIGASGDTVTLASGASQSGFGRTGTVDWQTGSIKTATFTAANGEGYFVNTTGGAVTVNLPAGSAGAIVSVSDYTRTFATNNLTISPNGSEKIGGVADDLKLAVNGQALTLIYVDGTEGWINVQNAEDTETGIVPGFITATGGNTVTTDGDFKVHAFTGPGTFTVCSVGNPAGSDTIQTLLVAGGGGGGGDRGSGAGAGGLILTPCAGIPVSATGYPISIGGGGSGGPGAGPGNPRNGGQGTNTTGFALTTIGGGFGRGGGGGIGPTADGGPGGSGGGGSDGCASSPRTGSGGPGTQTSQPGNSGTFGFGNPGGNAAAPPGGSTGGGGGAGAAGANATVPDSGDGGAGKSVTSIFGSAPKAFYGPSNGFYAGGGGGGGQSAAGDGSGGNRSPSCNTAGNGGSSPNRPGNATGDNGAGNTGGGGGGGSNIGSQGPGGSGGSGIVLIRYKFQ